MLLWTGYCWGGLLRLLWTLLPKPIVHLHCVKIVLVFPVKRIKKIDLFPSEVPHTGKSYIKHLQKTTLGSTLIKFTIKIHHDKVIMLRNLWDVAVGVGGAERIRIVKIQHEVSMK